MRNVCRHETLAYGRYTAAEWRKLSFDEQVAIQHNYRICQLIEYGLGALRKRAEGSGIFL
jgi:hypothetical protein